MGLVHGVDEFLLRRRVRRFERFAQAGHVWEMLIVQYAGLHFAADVAIICFVARKLRERNHFQKYFGKLGLFSFGAALCLATTASAQLFTPLHIFSAATARPGNLSHEKQP